MSGEKADAVFWAKRWEEAAGRSEYRSFFADSSYCWDQSAIFYDRQLGSDFVRVTSVLDQLERMDLMGPEKMILDLGSGTGSYAIPFARRCREVTAWDSSGEMNRILQQKQEAEGLKNIRICQADFFEEILPKRAYDLVFGSLNPALYHPGALERMMEFSRKACVYIGTAPAEGSSDGGVKNEKDQRAGGEETLNHILLGTDLSHHGSNDSRYPFHYLSALGYQPQLILIPCSWETRERREEAIRRLSSYYGGFPRIRPDYRSQIAAYVDSHLIDDWFIQKVDTQMGMVVWTVRDRGTAVEGLTRHGNWDKKSK